MWRIQPTEPNLALILPRPKAWKLTRQEDRLQIKAQSPRGSLRRRRRRREEDGAVGRMLSAG